MNNLKMILFLIIVLVFMSSKTIYPQNIIDAICSDASRQGDAFCKKYFKEKSDINALIQGLKNDNQNTREKSLESLKTLVSKQTPSSYPLPIEQITKELKTLIDKEQAARIKAEAIDTLFSYDIGKKENYSFLFNELLKLLPKDEAAKQKVMDIITGWFNQEDFLKNSALASSLLNSLNKQIETTGESNLELKQELNNLLGKLIQSNPQATKMIDLKEGE